jgi:hypothetical protein
MVLCSRLPLAGSLGSSECKQNPPTAYWDSTYGSLKERDEVLLKSSATSSFGAWL